MKTVILGGGVVGVCAAYYLAKEGHEVTLVERQAEAASETSFANAGLFAPGHATAWASPQAPITLLKSLVREDTALRFKFSADPKFYAWGLRFLMNCTNARQRANTRPKLRLCLYSQQKNKEIIDDTGIECDMLYRGLLYLHRRQDQLELGVEHMKFLKDNGHVQRVVDLDELVEIEPSLGPTRDKVCGAIYGPEDASGDSCMFSRNLAAYCEQKFGTEFRYGTTITGLRAEGDSIVAAVTDMGEVTGDLFVVSLGAYTDGIVRTVGVKVPIYPVKGYSLTMPIDGHNAPPTVGAVDEENLVAWTRMGDRMRMTSTAEFTGYDTSFKPSDFDNMMRVARELFPDGADYERPSRHACLRPMTPDGPPIFGRGRHANLYFDTGQGHMGWTMAAGSGKVITDIIAGREPEIDIKGMTLDRF
jgi:D-amino-acid dehydrogenase